MTKVRLVEFKFKDKAKNIWLDWSKELQKREAEVLATLKNEGVVSESCFLSSDGKSAFYFMEADDFELVKKAVETNPYPIDLEHKIARQSSLVKVDELECLFHFENRN